MILLKKNKPNCIIAARLNSKRLKNKNILKINGKSLLEIVIKVAIKSRIFDKIIVSTDSKKIAKIAQYSGAEVPFLRAKKLSGDKISILPVLKNILLQTDSKEKKINFFLYSTAILLKPNDLKKAYQKFIRNNSNFLIAIRKFNSHPLRCLEITKNKNLRFKWPKYKSKQSQELKQFYHDAGYFFAFKSSYFLKNGFDEKKNSYYLLSQNASVDINTREDFELAKILYNQKFN